MKFSIAIPAYKSTFLEDAIKSILNQTYTDWELIIVDDCSPEDLRSIVEPFLCDERISYYRNDQNCGAVDVVDNWNICLGYCTGDYVICMGDDDRLLPCCLDEYGKLIGKYPNLNIYHARTEIINEQGNVFDLQEQRPEWESVLSLIWNRWDHRNKQYIGDFCYSTEYLKTIGGYYKLPLAWGTDDITAVLAAKEKGIANMQAFGFQYRENRQTISCAASYAKIKILATVSQHEWFSVFIKNLEIEKLPSSDQAYQKTIEAPHRKFFLIAFSKNCTDYMKGNPMRLRWCLRQLQGFNYSTTTLIKWYLKSIFK